MTSCHSTLSILLYLELYRLPAAGSDKTGIIGLNPAGKADEEIMPEGERFRSARALFSRPPDVE